MTSATNLSDAELTKFGVQLADEIRPESAEAVERLHALFRQKGLPALRYLAGLPDEERTAAQEAFLTGGASLLVATNALMHASMAASV